MIFFRIKSKMTAVYMARVKENGFFLEFPSKISIINYMIWFVERAVSYEQRAEELQQDQNDMDDLVFPGGGFLWNSVSEG